MGSCAHLWARASLAIKVVRSSLAWALALLLVAVTGGTARATYPGADGAIAFAGSSFTTDFPPDLFGATERGDVYNLTGGCAAPDMREPDWSPDGGQLAFVSVSGGPPSSGRPSSGIFLSALGGQRRFLTDGVDPNWSPDGGRVLFSNQGDLWEIGTDGGGLRNLTSTPDLEEDWPVWSPDGSRIVFAAGQGPALRQLYSMNADGTNRVQLTTPATYGDYTQDIAPDWSPDGSRIVYERRVAYRDHPPFWALLTINANGGGEAMLSLYNHLEYPSHPSWSPSGKRIAFSSLSQRTSLPNGGIWTVDASGGDPHLVLQATGGPVYLDTRQADWGPAIPLSDRACSGPSLLKAASFKGVTTNGNQATWLIRCRAPAPKRCRVRLRLRNRGGELGRADRRIPGAQLSPVSVKPGRAAGRTLRRRGELRARLIAEVSFQLNPTTPRVVSRDSRIVLLTAP